MDAVAVSLVRGATGEHKILRALEIGAIFGIAQGLMPLIGWSVGVTFASTMADFGHWIAFALLSFLGLRMLSQAVSSGQENTSARRRTHYAGLIVAAVATSIDAAAAGITLPLLKLPIGIACLTIGLITAALCVPAYWLGTRASGAMGKAAEILGGIALIALGIKILIERLAA